MSLSSSPEFLVNTLCSHSGYNWAWPSHLPRNYKSSRVLDRGLFETSSTPMSRTTVHSREIICVGIPVGAPTSAVYPWRLSTWRNLIRRDSLPLYLLKNGSATLANRLRRGTRKSAVHSPFLHTSQRTRLFAKLSPRLAKSLHRWSSLRVVFSSRLIKTL